MTVMRSSQNESEHESDGDDSEATRVQGMRFGTELQAPVGRGEAGGLVGHLLAPGAQVPLLLSEHCGSALMLFSHAPARLLFHWRLLHCVCVCCAQ